MHVKGNLGEAVMVKRIIAPVVVGVLTIAAMVVYLCFVMYLLPFLWLKVVIIIVLACLAAAMVYVTVDRIKEIKKEDIDDVVSKY